MKVLSVKTKKHPSYTLTRETRLIKGVRFYLFKQEWANGALDIVAIFPCNEAFINLPNPEVWKAADLPELMDPEEDFFGEYRDNEPVFVRFTDYRAVYRRTLTRYQIDAGEDGPAYIEDF